MSLTVDEAIKLLQKPGTHFSGSDWKYGWPHKFYIGNNKFYNQQLKVATTEEIAAWSAVSEKFFGIAWARDEKGVKWMCKFNAGFYGYQRAGIVGPDGEPVRNDEWSVDYPKLTGPDGVN